MGLSGSLIREDERIGRLMSNVGPTLFRYTIERNIHIHIVHTPMKDEHKSVISKISSRTKFEQTFRALNPYKLYALDRIVQNYNGQKILVFCDTRNVASILKTYYSDSLMISGSDKKEFRSSTIKKFHNECNMLISTKISDTSINFPNGCIIVQFNISSGSRQQESQRCGRATRDDDQNTVYHMYHIVNDDTEEERFVQKRIKHINENGGCNVHINHEYIDANVFFTKSQLETCSLATKITIKRKVPTYKKIQKTIKK